METQPGAGLVAHTPHLFQRPLARRRRLLLLSNARLVVILSTPELRENASLLAGLLEATHGLLEGFVLLNFDDGHVFFSLPAARGWLDLAPRSGFAFSS